MEHLEPLRICLIGKTGAGKSALCNTLLGKKVFKSEAAAESVTEFCQTEYGQLSNGRRIKIVDTPGIKDTKGRDMRNEVTKAIAALSPGPHAILIVLQPSRATKEEKETIEELRGLFGDDLFLKHTILIMTRMRDLEDEDKDEDDQMTIQEYMQDCATEGIQSLYRACGERIVGVENKSTKKKKEKYALEIAAEIVKIGGYYPHVYFQLLEDKKIQEQENARLRREIQILADKLNRSFCILL